MRASLTWRGHELRAIGVVRLVAPGALEAGRQADAVIAQAVQPKIRDLAGDVAAVGGPDRDAAKHVLHRGVLQLDQRRDSAGRSQHHSKPPEELRLFVSRIVLNGDPQDRVLHGRHTAGVVRQQQDRRLGDRFLRAAAAAQDRLAHVHGFGRLDDAAQRRVDYARRRGPLPGQQQIVKLRPVDVVAENRGAGRIIDVQVRDLVAVREGYRVPGAAGVGQARRRLAAGRWRRAEQLLPVLQADAAVERRGAIRWREHGNGGAGGCTALDSGERGSRTTVRTVTVGRGTGADEPSSLVRIARTVGRRLRQGRGRPDHDKGTDDAETESQVGHGVRKAAASYSGHAAPGKEAGAVRAGSAGDGTRIADQCRRACC